MGLLYSDLQVMGSLYVTRNLLPLTHFDSAFRCCSIVFSILLGSRDAAITGFFTPVARIADN